MIIVRIVGGLASQLHKYAVGRALALRLNTELKLDLDWFENPPPSDTPWPYQLDKFNLDYGIASLPEVRQVRGHPLWNRVVRRVNRYLGNPLFGSHEVDIGAVTLQQWMKLPDNVYLYGEAMGIQLIQSIRPLLLQEFQLRAPLSSDARQYAQKIHDAAYAVSLHVRRGDYISNASAAQFHTLTGLDYFHEAVAAVLLKHSNTQFFVFSDDPDWVTAHLLPSLPQGAVTVKYLNNEEDFLLMSKCQGNIISNSGFGWFAAWLNDSPDRMVISPKRWFQNKAFNDSAMKALHQCDWIYL